MDSRTVRWEELLPREFRARQDQMPLVYLPLGLCEPHGHIAAFGLDTFKAVWLCEQAASRFGGIVAPTQGYQIHETGYHRPWLKEVIGDTNPNLGSVPPDVLLRMLLFQLRAFVNAGFRGAVLLTGHHGNQADLRIVAEELMTLRPIRIVTVSDPELARVAFHGDHAGKYEISQLLFIRPDLVDLDRAGDISTSPLGRFAQGEDASEATAGYGREILEHSLEQLERLIRDSLPFEDAIDPLGIEETDEIWQSILARRGEWRTLSERNPDLAREA
ncbi:creatininase family protein [Arthrobacter sp. M4]|uniref:creatininase family protein n=1 Tax=Arthrobacter sp. M4 TaxID=218160 RepID=UPI001CDD84C7|nr:creatininase family protein [Arthrobacter sp. M4]MCA4134842.1 creatininase family protein [Arthrobacter sp. M4]